MSSFTEIKLSESFFVSWVYPLFFLVENKLDVGCFSVDFYVDSTKYTTL